MLSYGAKTALLGNLIDYAGTFPPAALPLQRMMQEAVSFRRAAKHPWLLSKIVVALADLPKLTARAWMEAGADGTPLPLTVIGSVPQTAEELVRTLAFELREVRAFNAKHRDSSLSQRVLAYETRIPEDATEESLPGVVEDCLAAAQAGGVLGVDVYLELPLGGADSGHRRLSRFAAALADWQSDHESGLGTAGIKIRTGGQQVPEATQLAQTLSICAAHGLRFKATQGLHHAITQGPKEYGFVNLFAALAFAQALGVDSFNTEAVHRCLVDTRAGAFDFRPDVLRWDAFEMPVEQIEAARRRHAGTFGSCSLDEPDTYLEQEL